MSDELEKLKSENLQYQNTLQAFSGQLRARKQMSDELYEANINLRSSQVLLEDQNKLLTNQVKELTDKVAELEKKSLPKN